MNRIVALAVAIGLGGAPAADAAPREPRECTHPTQRYRPFTMEIPHGFRILETMRGEDFMSYAVYRGSVPYVGLYVGNYPNIGRPGGPGELRDDRANRRKIRVMTEDGHARIAGYSMQSNCPDWPRLIEAWAYDVSDDQDTADRLASTVRARP